MRTALTGPGEPPRLLAVVATPDDEMSGAVVGMTGGLAAVR